MEIIDKLKIALKALDEKKADDIQIIEISEISSIADYFLIATGDNERLVRSLYDEIDEKLSKEKIYPLNVEGLQHANWILMDYGDFIIHIFDKENRNFYKLERIWKDGKLIDLHDLI